MGVYSLSKLAMEIEFEVEDFIPLLHLFIDTTKEDLEGIRFAALRRDSTAVSTCIHNIKGSSLNLGLGSITELLDQLSTLNKKGYYTDIENIVQKCESELSNLEMLLES